MNASLMLLVLSLGGSPSEPSVSPRAAHETPVAVERVGLEVDHGPLLEQQKAEAAEKSGFFVRGDATQALRDRHHVEVADDAGPVIMVKLAWKDYENSVYLIEVATRRPGEAPRVVESFEATCINNSALTEAVLAKLPAALDQLAQPPENATPDPVVEDPAAEPAGPVVVEDPNADRTERVPLGPMGKAGAGLLASGAVGVITGGIVFAQQQRYDEDLEREAQQGRDFRPPGIGLMVAGGAVAVTGAVLLIIDRGQARRARRPAKPRVSLMPTTRGLVITGRF